MKTGLYLIAQNRVVKYMHPRDYELKCV
uniref:Uncharacterized protein n=1 Tax=Nelumbo nucifera TaxID=4432 RepID=A0A822XEH0_NELNU|nr:TPA_asm: hypothetical protein HUJ06_020050 [Nelumbo nucifera]